MQVKKIQAQIVTWNSNAWIGPLLASLKKQTHPLHRICVIDNGSTDGTREALSKDRSLEVVLLGKNTGYSFAHNEGIARGLDCEFILCLNPDVELNPNAVQLLVDTLIDNPSAASVSSVLLQEPLTNHQKNRIVDSAGIGKSRTFSFFNLFEGRPEFEISPVIKNVFANTGACVLFRKASIEKVSLKREGGVEYFDEDFFAYKEDIDLGWRLQKAGWKNLCAGTPIGFHKRTVRKQLSHKNFSHNQVFLSYRNHLLLLVKNLSLKEFFANALWIISYELVKLFYLIITRPKTTLSALRSFTHLFGRIKEKRIHESIHHNNSF